MKFHAADWRSDPKLRACSLAGRGLWIEMIGLMHEANPYGHLLINGHAPGIVELARQVGATPREVKAGLEELRANDVFSVNEADVIFSRRMVRAAKQSATNVANGRRGGNPALSDNRAAPKSDNRSSAEADIRLLQISDKTERLEARGENPQPPPGLLVADEIAETAGEFLRRYPVVYARCRSGAHYRVKESRDFSAAIELCQDYQPIDRLEAMLEVFLKRTDTREMGKPGSPRQFQHFAPDCDRLLREHGR